MTSKPTRYDDLVRFPSYKDHAKMLYLWDTLGTCSLDHVQQTLSEETNLPSFLWRKFFYGQTAFHQLVQNDQINVHGIKSILSVCKSKSCLEPLINQKNREGNTALHLAGARMDGGEALFYLLDHPDVDVHIRNNKGLNAMGTAGMLNSKKKTQKLIEIFSSKGLSIHDRVQPHKDITLIDQWTKDSEYWDQMLAFLQQLRDLYPTKPSLTTPKIK